MSRTRKCTSQVTAGRLTGAVEFLDSVELLADDSSNRNAAAALFVEAGIAAADVVCCKRLGEHAQGQDRNDAVSLLARADRDLATCLGTLLTHTSRISDSAQVLPSSEFTKVQRAATQLTAAARRT